MKVARGSQEDTTKQYMVITLKNVAGIDVHKNFLEIAYREKGRVRTEEIPYDPEGLNKLIRLLKGLGINSVYIESTGNYYYPLYYALKGAGVDVRIMNAYKIKRPEPNKTDERDAVWLLKVGESQLFPHSYVPEEDMLALRTLLRARFKLVDTIADYKRRVRGQLWALGVTINNISNILRSRKKRKIFKAIIEGKHIDGAEDLSIAMRPVLKRSNVRAHLVLIKTYLETIDRLEDSLSKLDKEIRSIAAKYEEDIRILMSVPGVSFILAAAILSEISDVSRFPSPKHLASYAGLAPVVRGSGGKLRTITPSRKSNKYLRRYMFVASLAASRSKSLKVKEFVNRLSSRGKHFKVVIVALARKLLTIIWYLLTKRMFWSEDSYSKMPPHLPRVRGNRIPLSLAIEILRRAGYVVRLKKRYKEK